MKNRTFYLFIIMLLVASIAFWGWMFHSSDAESSEPPLFDSPITLTMYHAEGCNCCTEWAKYLERNDVNVSSVIVEDLQEVKREKGVPGQLSSCHTAVADGYVIEGHVPIEDIRRLLAERPAVIGVSVPGMPPNAPGMDMPVNREFFSVLFSSESMTIFNTHR